MTTAIYARYSSTNQDGGVSIETQLDVCRKLAGSNPLEFIDRAISGRTMHRQAFREMMDAAETGKFTRLIVYKWDRFGRNAETHSVIADMEDIGITVESATEGGDWLARSVGLVVSESYSKQLSQRVRDSMRTRFKLNRSYMGGVIPYGYQVIKGTDGLSRFAIHPDEAAVVRLVYKLYLKESIGSKLLARRLHELGHRPRVGLKFGWTTINRILHTPTYTGLVRYGRHSEKLDRRSGKVTKVPRTDSLSFTDESLRIISDKDHAKVQAILVSKSTGSRATKNLRPLSNRCICGVCGNVMYARHTSNQQRPVYRYMVCGRRDRWGKNPVERGCNNPARPTEGGLLNWIQDGIRNVMRHKDRIIARAVELAEKALDTNDQQRAKFEADLSKLEQGITRFSRMLRDPSMDDGQVKGLLSQIGTMEKEREELNQSLRALAGQASFDRHALIREIKAAFTEAEESILNVSDIATINRGVERFVGGVVVEPDGSYKRLEHKPQCDQYHRPPARGYWCVEDSGGAAIQAAFWSFCIKQPPTRRPSSTELAPHYGVSPQTIRRWRVLGKLSV